MPEAGRQSVGQNPQRLKTIPPPDFSDQPILAEFPTGTLESALGLLSNAVAEHASRSGKLL